MPYNRVVFLRIEEFEAVRLVDYLDLSQHEAAAKMGISQKSLCNDLKRARLKIADAIIHGKGIKIEGGDYALRRKNNEMRYGTH